MKSAKKSSTQTKIVVFGSNKFKELIVEPSVVLEPKFVNIESSCVKTVASGAAHSLICLCDGTILCCGDNSKNQFGKKEIKSNFEKIGCLKNDLCVNVACGDYFSLAVTDKGKLYSWGSNDFSQLGRDGESDKIRMVSSLSSYFIVQVACGESHCLALTQESILFTWGDNHYGQLGLGVDSKTISHPQIITSLDCLPVRQISCGKSFSIILTPSGSVYSWGHNDYGQLGIGTSTTESPSSAHPTYLKSIKGIHIVYISSGSNHNALLTIDGGIFTFGHGGFGQLGHSGFDDHYTPRKVADLMGSVVTQISCGVDFTLVYIANVTKVFGCGKNDLGQLGIQTDTEWIDTPKEILDFPVLTKNTSSESSRLRRIICGCNRTFILVTDEKYESTEDLLETESSTEFKIATINMVEINKIQNSGKTLTSDLFSLVYIVFGSLGCLSASFLDKGEKNSHFSLTKTKHGVDIEAAVGLMNTVFKQLDENEMEMLRVHIFENMLSLRSHLKNYPAVECLRGFLILLISPFIGDVQSYEKITVPLFKAINNFSISPRNILDSWLSTLKPRYFKRLVEHITGLINYNLSAVSPNRQNKIPSKSENEMAAALDFMKILYAINERSKIISYTQFYVPSITDKIDIEQSFIQWATANSNYQAAPFSFCRYPFVFDGKAKTKLLHVEAGLFMRNAVLEAHTHIIMTLLNATESDVISVENPFFVIAVNRDTILEDTVKALEATASGDFKKPLKISFSNEEAVDDGGVVKEYFLLVIREIMLPKHGLFKCFKQSNMCYFQQNVNEKDNIYKCVGQLCGLAIYNGVIIDLHFPLALFKKLLSEVPNLDDVLELDPVLGRSLQQILDYFGDDFQETFSLYHEIAWEDSEGEMHRSELITDGSSFPVTLDNKEQFVMDYVHFILNENVASSFNAFKLGFYLVCVGSVLRLFRPIELQEMTVGCEITDWDQIQKNAKYDHEYWRGHQVIIWFWEVFKELKETDKKCFLRFLTGCDRAPITGLGDFTIVIQPTNGGDEFFPVAHTCYNLLDLPKYSSKDILKKRLLVAISYTEGFTLV